jgi:hypothetical protein
LVLIAALVYAGKIREQTCSICHCSGFAVKYHVHLSFTNKLLNFKFDSKGDLFGGQGGIQLSHSVNLLKKRSMLIKKGKPLSLPFKKLLIKDCLIQDYLRPG